MRIMDRFSPKTVFSSIDTQGRYAYGNQPSILIWNLCRLAETLIPLIDDNKDRAVLKFSPTRSKAMKTSLKVSG